jgi:serine/threonine-protein kinase
MMVASYTLTDGEFVPGRPRLWAAKKDLGEWFDLSPDGSRFAILENAPPDEGSPTHVTFLLNFVDELRRRVPAASR